MCICLAGEENPVEGSREVTQEGEAANKWCIIRQVITIDNWGSVLLRKF